MDERVRDKTSRATITGRTALAIREVLEGRRRGAGMVLPFAGPAIVVSVAYMDPGNFATNIQAGARYGYALLWVVLLANVVAMLFQGLSAKLGIVTGRNLAELCRENFPAPLVLAMWAVSDGDRSGRVSGRRNRPRATVSHAVDGRHDCYRHRHVRPAAV
jgi:manganese transport protein